MTHVYGFTTALNVYGVLKDKKLKTWYCRLWTPKSPGYTSFSHKSDLLDEGYLLSKGAEKSLPAFSRVGCAVKQTDSCGTTTLKKLKEYTVPTLSKENAMKE